MLVELGVVERATARPTCDALGKAMRAWGVPDAILTDNAKAFTGRFGPSAGGEVLFDWICRENGIKHILTAPRSPTTTGKVERWHKTLRREFLAGKGFESIADARRRSMSGCVTATSSAAKTGQTASQGIVYHICGE